METRFNDTLFLPCPNCKRLFSARFQEDNPICEPEFRTYDLSTAPVGLIAHARKQTYVCPKCATKFGVALNYIATTQKVVTV